MLKKKTCNNLLGICSVTLLNDKSTIYDLQKKKNLIDMQVRVLQLEAIVGVALIQLQPGAKLRPRPARFINLFRGFNAF